MYLNECYFINYLGGTGGNFIQQLITRIIHNKNDIITGENGNAHGLELRIYENYYAEQEYYDHIQKNIFSKPIHEYLIPRHENFPVTATDHAVPIWDKMFTKFPNSKNIIIRCNHSNIEKMIANLFFKVNLADPKLYKLLKNNNPYFKNYEDPNLIPNDVIQKYVIDSSNTARNSYITFPYHEDHAIPTEYSDRIFVIKFDDIYNNNSDAVLSQLSLATGKPITDNIRKLYQTYIDRQEKLIDEKMPWIRAY